jgi:hypothetical protein
MRGISLPAEELLASPGGNLPTHQVISIQLYPRRRQDAAPDVTCNTVRASYEQVPHGPHAILCAITASESQQTADAPAATNSLPYGCTSQHGCSAPLTAYFIHSLQLAETVMSRRQPHKQCNSLRNVTFYVVSEIWPAFLLQTG